MCIRDRYTPLPGFIGSDTVMYKICSSSDVLNCVINRVIIVVKDTSADNSVSASDDFYFTDKNIPLQALLPRTNDMDPESDDLTITPQGSSVSPIMNSGGSYYIVNDGSLYFTPATNFVGPVDICLLYTSRCV